MTEVTIQAADGGTFTGYLARPATGRGPGIVVIQEIFGVNQVMRDVCDGLAAQGYFALCPDLFWRQEPGIQLTDRTDAEWARAFELYKGFSETKGVEDLIAALNLLRGTDGCTGRVGCIGYCLGGKLAYLMATRSNVDCSVGYYGVAIEKNLDEATAIDHPLLMHIAEKDQFVPPAARERILESTARNARITAHVYPGVDHAFAR
ncbi:MAG TPA: dienelactone hydrolase family protein, partial [Arenibaculum sp.]|nr:dienelactone hydrolase family protein [Arenibaculum sp.]